MKKQKNYPSSHSLSPAQQNNQGIMSSHSLAKDPHNQSNQQFDSQTYEFNFKVLSRQPALRNLQKILFTLSFVNLAKYQSNGDYWNYLKIKGPLFVVIDKYSQIKFAILNQCSTENQVIHVQKEMKFELKNLGKDGYLLNYCIQDSIMGNSIYGIWTADKTIEKVWISLKQYLSSNQIKKN